MGDLDKRRAKRGPEGHGGHRVYSKDISTVYEGDCEEIVAHLRSTAKLSRF
jgi:hypothetical protein